MPKSAEIPSAVLVDSNDFSATSDGTPTSDEQEQGRPQNEEPSSSLTPSTAHQVPKVTSLECVCLYLSLSPIGQQQQDVVAPSKSVRLKSVKQLRGDMCPGDKDVIVFKSPGYRLRDSATDESTSSRNGANTTELAHTTMSPFQQTSSETECIFSCLINLARGRNPYECVAATYNSEEGQCFLYGSGNDLDGNVHLIPDAAHNHYEKGCIVMDLVELCKGYPVVRHPQKTLLGFAIGSKLAGSFIECIELCFTERQQLGNGTTSGRVGEEEPQPAGCKSIMFFYENSESRETAPAFFVDENEALVDYASFESCYGVEETPTTAAESKPNEPRTAVDSPPPVQPLEPIDSRRRAPPIYYTVDSDHPNCTAERHQHIPHPAQVQEGVETGEAVPKAIPLPERFRPPPYSTSYGPLANAVHSYLPPPQPPMARMPPMLGVLPGLLRVDSDRREEEEEKDGEWKTTTTAATIQRRLVQSLAAKKRSRLGNYSADGATTTASVEKDKKMEQRMRQEQRRRRRQRMRNILRKSIKKIKR